MSSGGILFLATDPILSDLEKFENEEVSEVLLKPGRGIEKYKGEEKSELIGSKSGGAYEKCNSHQWVEE